MKALLFLALLSLPSRADEAAPVFPPACQQGCVTTYGEMLGATKDGTEAYSNCQPKCVFEKPSYVDKTYAGIEWQCVEYARRWLLRNKGLTFASIDVAADLWNKVDHLEDVKTKAAVPLRRRENGADSLPRAGDLLIYGREYLETGHVAVVVRVDSAKKLVYVAEENFANAKWPGTYARTLPFVRHGKGYWLLDRYLLGWLQY